MKTLICFLCFATSQVIMAQSLLESLEEDNKNIQNEPELVEGTFKSIRLINGQTIETTEKKGLNIIISHRFGNIKDGVYEYFGIDQALMRLGAEYGLTNRIALGYGRGNFQKLYDGYFKIRLLQQSTGVKSMPLSLTWYSDVAVISQKWSNPSVDYKFIYRMNYVNELIIARKFNPKFSLQLIAGAVHRNLVDTKKDKNTLPYISLGGRRSITNRMALTGEYYYAFMNNGNSNYHNSFSIGLDIETGGHVFQLHFSNSRGMTEKAFITESTNDWAKGDIHFGFNIIRTFKF